jgi:SnoaL-like domain
VIDELGIRRLVNAYAVAVDHRDEAKFVRLWAPTGVLVIHGDGPDRPKTNEFRIPTDVARFIESLGRWDRLLHMVSTHHVVVDGDRATGEAYCDAHYVLGSDDLVMAVRYGDDYLKVQSEWLLLRRAVNIMWTSTSPVTVTG